MAGIVFLSPVIRTLSTVYTICLDGEKLTSFLEKKKIVKFSFGQELGGGGVGDVGDSVGVGGFIISQMNNK